MSIQVYPNIAKVKRNNAWQNLPGFVQQSGDADIEAMIANKETSTTAQFAHAKDSFFILNDILYQADANISVNGTIAVGTNCHVAVLGNDVFELIGDVNNINSTLIEINNGNKDCLLEAKFYDGYYNGSDVYTGTKTETIGSGWGVVVVPVPVGKEITISGFSATNGTHSCWLNSNDPSDVNSYAWNSNLNNKTTICKTAWLGISDYNYIGTKNNLKVIYEVMDEISNRIDDNKSQINALLYEDPLDGIANVSHQYLQAENSTSGYFYDISNNTLIKGGGGTANASIFTPIPVKAGKTYYVKHVYGYFCILDDGGTLSRITSNTTSAYTGTFTPTNNGFIYMTINHGAPTPNILTDAPYTDTLTQSESVFNASLIADGYVHIKISATNGDYADPITAVRNITDASETKQYMLDIYPGTYHLEDYITSAEQQGSIWGLKLPDYVHMRGIGERDDIILDCSLDNDASSTAVEYTSTLNINSNNSLENITFTGTNVRYVVHDESSNTIKNWKRIVKNCKFVHNGNAEGFWSYTYAWGEGCSSALIAELEALVALPLAC